jgi:hypothetical protein
VLLNLSLEVKIFSCLGVRNTNKIIFSKDHKTGALDQQLCVIISCAEITCFSSINLKHQQQGVLHTVAFAIYYIEKYLKAKEELWKLKYFTMQKL